MLRFTQRSIPLLCVFAGIHLYSPNVFIGLTGYCMMILTTNESSEHVFPWAPINCIYMCFSLSLCQYWHMELGSFYEAFRVWFLQRGWHFFWQWEYNSLKCQRKGPLSPKLANPTEPKGHGHSSGPLLHLLFHGYSQNPRVTCMGGQGTPQVPIIAGGLTGACRVCGT